MTNINNVAGCDKNRNVYCEGYSASFYSNEALLL